MFSLTSSVQLNTRTTGDHFLFKIINAFMKLHQHTHVTKQLELPAQEGNFCTITSKPP